MLSIAQIQSVDDLPREEVTVPEWGGSIWVRLLPSLLKDRFDRMVADRSGSQAFRAMLVAFAACDDKGDPAFADPVAAAVVLEGKSSVVIGRLFDAAARLNGMSKEATEEAAKN